MMPVENLSAEMQTIGNYDLLDKIAEGGMGTVYRGKNRSSGDIVAVKIVPPHLLTNAVVVKRFEQEYNVARQIDHPNIVKAIDLAKARRAKVFGIVGRDSGYTAKHGDLVVLIPQVDPNWVTPLSEAFQAVVWHCLVSHPSLQRRPTKW